MYIYKFSYDGDVVNTLSTSLTYNFIPPDGYYTFSVRCANNANLLCDYMHYHFYVDRTSPSVNNLKGPSNWTNSDRIDFSWTGYDATSGIQNYAYHIDSGSDTTIDKNDVNMQFSIDAPADGQHTFHVKAVDMANLAGAYSSVNFKVDRNPPVINTLKGPTDWVSQTTITFSWKGSDIGSGT